MASEREEKFRAALEEIAALRDEIEGEPDREAFEGDCFDATCDEDIFSTGVACGAAETEWKVAEIARRALRGES